MSKSLISTQSQELRDETPRGLPLVVTIPGLTDAGSSVAGLNEFIWNSADPQVIIRFSNDDLLDYRARRPLITLQDETLIDYEAEELVLAVAHDQLGSQFLHLSGFEPDYRWEAFIDEVLGLVDEFEVAHTSIFHAIPMPVPHRRPVQFTLSGTREDLISHNSTWKPTTRIAASVTNLLEYRLAQLDDDVMSWAAMVPHYLAGSDYPTGVLGLISAMSKSTGLIFDTDEVRKRSDTFLDAVDAQIAESRKTSSKFKNSKIVLININTILLLVKTCWARKASSLLRKNLLASLSAFLQRIFRQTMTKTIALSEQGNSYVFLVA